MSDEIIRPKINLKEQETIKCEKCESRFFKEVTMLKKVPKLLTGSPEDTIPNIHV
jgi:DNA-directed RNA polymerase subunit RPC12/RpoP